MLYKLSPLALRSLNSNNSAGGAGGRSPLAGARGVPAQSPSFSGPPQAVRESYLNSYL